MNEDAGSASSAPPPPPADPHVPTVATPEAKADLGKRFVAFLIDAVIAGVIATVLPGIGGLIGAAYMICRDGLDFDFMKQRSVGKQIMKLRLESVEGAPVDIMTSVRRNWMFGLGYLIPLLLFIPILGWMAIPFVALGAVALGVIEIVLVLTDAEGRRIGDKIASTRVSEGSA